MVEVRATITIASTATCGPPTPNLESYYINSSDVFCFLLFFFCPSTANIDILPSGVPGCFSIWSFLRSDCYIKCTWSFLLSKDLASAISCLYTLTLLHPDQCLMPWTVFPSLLCCLRIEAFYPNIHVLTCMLHPLIPSHSDSEYHTDHRHIQPTPSNLSNSFYFCSMQEK